MGSAVSRNPRRARSDDVHPMLTASEIGAFIFCPEAWYLRRSRVPVTSGLEQRRLAGLRLHRRIGRRSDVIRIAEAVRAVLLVVILMSLLLLASLALKGFE